ncbi:MAG: tyrosine-type recombinase/integrase, partial [Gemmatimonadota bacterium]
AEIEAKGLTGADKIFALDYDRCYDEHKKTCNLAGIVNYTIHDHRHTFAVHAARAGMPLHLLAQQLGHKNIEMTMKYTRFHPDYCDVGKYFDRVSESFGIAGPTGYKSGYTPPETTDKQIAETP